MSSTLRPPSASPSPSPGPGNENGRVSNRASMGPSAFAAQGIQLASPRPGGVSGARPTSELLGSSGMFQTPEAEAIDQWFENLQNYEATLEEMAAASLDVNFKEELSAIEQWFKVLSEAERTAALYSLLQHSTQVQIRFFITVLQQMARADPMTALLSPAVGGSMQAQMEAKLASMSLKSPALKSPLPASPSARNFSTNRQSLALDASSSFLSPESANITSPNSHDAAATLAHQRAKLNARNAAHRISAPPLASSAAGEGRNVWSTGLNSLGQVEERRSPSPAQEVTIPTPSTSSRPKSTDFSGLAKAFQSPRPSGDVEQSVLSPMVSDSWASMVNTPLIPMFKNNREPSQNLDAAATKLNDWTSNTRVPIISDPPKPIRRGSKGTTGHTDNQGQNGYAPDTNINNMNNNLLSPNSQQPGPQQQQQQRNASGGLRNVSGSGGFGGPAGWSGGAKSPALSSVSSNRFNGSDDGSMAGLGMGGFNMNMGMGSPGLGMGLPGAGGLGMPGLAGMGQMGQINPLMNMNMLNMANLSAMGISPEAQLLAAQMAAAQAQGFGQPGLNPFMGLQQQQQQQQLMNARNNNNRGGGRSPGTKTSSANGRDNNKKDEEEVDPKVLEDVAGWLRSLRLHKYTPNFEGMNWRQMVVMNEEQLEQHGVAALGARRKMLKTFEAVRKKMGIEAPSD
ncbi:hypothetical protein JAAARDRAFT_170214 [Jaapia argillacea MUCL 33604]|uniref:RNA-binding protein VTS1 n=1 Tax=Jaapia argillacea MUCL 33604 TaxID=933084 RepID=A0A067Q7A7_9AGAM|nr:hypothetical protein JAAARDRAFT_170214 [Jaapia argillacea MUCL 33604]